MKHPTSLIEELREAFHANLIGSYVQLRHRNAIRIRFKQTDTYQKAQLEVQKYILKTYYVKCVHTIGTLMFIEI